MNTKKILHNAWTAMPLWAHKLVLFIALLVYFRWGYLATGSVNRHHPDPLSADIFLDHLIPLMPSFILFYMLGYVFVAAPMFLIHQRREAYLYATVFFVLLSVSFLIFTQLPIAMDKDIALGRDWLSRLTRFQQQVDTRYNNFPSLHVSLNVFTYLFLRYKHPLLGRWLIWVVAFVVASTLLVKQHLVVDCLSGMMAGILAYQLYRRLAATPFLNGASHVGPH